MIVYIYEVWHFKEQSKELFHPYIKTFMNIKQEASGWPAECDTEEKKRNYLQQYEDDDEFLLGKVRAMPQSNASHYMYETVRIFPNHQRRLASDS